MTIPQIITTLGVCGLVCYTVWWALQRVRSLPATPKAQATKDAVIEAFALVVATIQPDSEECIRACEIIRIEVAEKIMPMGSDPK